jgi:hypothetical protein
MDTRCVLVRVERHDIGLLCSLMAGYEGVAMVRTVDPRQGIVVLLVAPAFYTTVLDIVQALSQEMPLCLLEEDRPADSMRWGVAGTEQDARD